MSIANIAINVQDLDRAIDFYRRHLGAEVLHRNHSDCVLDLVTATIELREPGDLADNPWEADDLAYGFRHLGWISSEPAAPSSNFCPPRAPAALASSTRRHAVSA